MLSVIGNTGRYLKIGKIAFFSALWVVSGCAHVWVYVCAHMGAHVYVEPVVLDTGSQGIWSLPVHQVWLTCKLQGSSCVCLPGARITGTQHDA